MGKMKDLFMLDREREEQREQQELAARECEFLTSRGVPPSGSSSPFKPLSKTASDFPPNPSRDNTKHHGNK